MLFLGQIQIEGIDKDALDAPDESNAIVLPSTKRKTKVTVAHEGKVKKLTKKERKRLEKVVERRTKKAKVTIRTIKVVMSCMFTMCHV